MHGKAFGSRGEFLGFVTNPKGKRRARLRIEGHEVDCKFPRELRRRHEEHLAVGQTLEIEGRIVTDEFTGEEKRIVDRLRIVTGAVPAAACATCTIRVCTKKNCWHSGGKALWHFFEEKISAAGASGAVRLEAVRCLDHCKHAPVVAVGKKAYVGCDRETAAQLVAGLAPES
jgi:hypothetical protein